MDGKAPYSVKLVSQTKLTKIMKAKSIKLCLFAVIYKYDWASLYAIKLKMSIL